VMSEVSQVLTSVVSLAWSRETYTYSGLGFVLVGKGTYIKQVICYLTLA
jgi:hypothetical protein